MIFAGGECFLDYYYINANDGGISSSIHYHNSLQQQQQKCSIRFVCSERNTSYEEDLSVVFINLQVFVLSALVACAFAGYAAPAAYSSSYTTAHIAPAAYAATAAFYKAPVAYAAPAYGKAAPAEDYFVSNIKINTIHGYFKFHQIRISFFFSKTKKKKS